MKFKILHQGLLLISIPLICELAVFGILVKLELDAEGMAERAAKARAISDGVNGLESDIHGLVRYMRSLQYDEALRADFRPHFQKLYSDLDQLNNLTADKPQYLSLIKETTQAVHEGQWDIEEARRSLTTAPWNTYNIVKKARKKIDDDIALILSPQLLSIAENSTDDSASQNAEAARRNVRLALYAALPISILVTIIAAFIFTRRISNRVMKLSKDADAMAIGQELKPVMSGSDEIAYLDEIYHRTAEMLSDSNRKLQAAYDYAADLIVSIDSKSRILAVNKTCVEMLGLTPDKLVHQYIDEIVDRADKEKFDQLLTDAQFGKVENKSLEISLVHSDGKLIPAVCIPRYSKLEQATFCVFHDISARKEAERIRNEVFAMVTHDLRAPVSSFRNFLELVEMGKIGNLSETGEKLLPLAERGVSTMSRLLDDILTLEKVKSGMLELELKPVSINEVLNEVSAPIYFAAEKRSVKITVEPTPYVVMTDRARFEQVLLNFISNALKFSPADSLISLSCKMREDELFVSVKDQGSGIKPEEINSVFSRFYQASKGESDLPSSGLGLTICQELAQLLGTRLDVQSEPGKGSIFSIVFPGERLVDAKNTSS
jgi:two-component system, OmpR family, phosphate regulon sensor histidine kinase PhoR